MDLVQIKFDGIKVGDINIPKQTFKVPEDVSAVAETILTAAYDSAAALKVSLDSNSALQAKCDELEKSQKELQEKHDALEKGSPEQLATAVKSRLGLEKTASFFKIDKMEEMQDGELMKAVIMSQNPELKLDEKDDAYVKARFDILSETAEKGATGLEQLKALNVLSTPKGDDLSAFTGGGNQNGELNPAMARENFMQQSKDAYKSPPGSVIPKVQPVNPA